MARADQRKIHYIYKISRFDNKYYIGLHSTDNLEDDYFGSGTLLARSIKKYGKDKHSKEILEFCSSREALKLREKELVNEELLEDKNCLNLKLGGIGGWDHISSNSISKRAETFKSRNYKTTFSKATLKLLSDQKLGNKNFENSSRFAGKTCSDEHRKKISEKNKRMTGEKNSQFGTCWVTDGVKPIKIKKEFLDEYLNKGYSKGRK